MTAAAPPTLHIMHLPVMAWRWFFLRPAPIDSTEHIILWWELRRIPYNALIGFTGITSILLYLAFIISSGTLEPGDDAINGAYTLGWLVELTLRVVGVRNTGPSLMKLGVGFSLAVICVPVVAWGLTLFIIMLNAFLT
jgi:hypothetical protein